MIHTSVPCSCLLVLSSCRSPCCFHLCGGSKHLHWKGSAAKEDTSHQTGRDKDMLGVARHHSVLGTRGDWSKSDYTYSHANISITLSKVKQLGEGEAMQRGMVSRMGGKKAW